jgi:hypothetical protein
MSDLMVLDNGGKFDNGIGGNRMILEAVSTDLGTLKCKGTPKSYPLQGNSDEHALSVDEWNNKRLIAYFDQ